ncbi:hypothetical protein GCM10023116_24950 [Kistimonas scapharcae]|uniref:Uncharacterized protein n=2 Tax=Kistimonas scapharcae TaxID=1036133 RepID=A0ABP8V313_9GAMM
MEGELYALNRLRIGPSRIFCTSGAGQGLFISDRNCKPQQAVFQEGECILRNISGITAFRMRDEKSKKYLEWLYYDDCCFLLTDDSDVIWSGFTIENLEIGVLPDGPAMFINDSVSPNCGIQAFLTQGFVNINSSAALVSMPEQTTPTKASDEKKAILAHFSHTLLAINFEVIAEKPLLQNTELLWCYNPIKAPTVFVNIVVAPTQAAFLS